MSSPRDNGSTPEGSEIGRLTMQEQIAVLAVAVAQDHTTLRDHRNRIDGIVQNANSHEGITENFVNKANEEHNKNKERVDDIEKRVGENETRVGELEKQDVERDGEMNLLRVSARIHMAEIQKLKEANERLEVGLTGETDALKERLEASEARNRQLEVDMAIVQAALLSQLRSGNQFAPESQSHQSNLENQIRYSMGALTTQVNRLCSEVQNLTVQSSTNKSGGQHVNADADAVHSNTTKTPP